jgi:hypothetical protein
MKTSANTGARHKPFKHERQSDRFDSELPVDLGGVPGLTRNISATGVYFETVSTQEPGARVQFTVMLTVHGEQIRMLCDGEVIRVDHKDDTLGIAVKLSSTFFTESD